jgi:hypothetical protein
MVKQLLNWLTVAIIATMVFTALEFVPIGNIVKAATPNSQVSATANVPGTLYTSITPTSFTWNGYPTTQSYTDTLITVNDINGNIPGNIFIWGSADLTYGSNNIAIGNILWNPTSVNSYTGNSVTTTLTNTLIVVPAPSLTLPSTGNSIYLGANIPAGTPAGLYTGNVYFENENGSITSSNAILAVTVNVLSTCFISLSTNAINFGTILSGSNTVSTSNSIQDTDNGGNAPATIYVYGGNWIGPAQFGVSNTTWSAAANTPYSSATRLSSAPSNTLITIAAPTQSNSITSSSVYFGVGVPGGAPVGAYTQNIVIEDSC